MKRFIPILCIAALASTLFTSCYRVQPSGDEEAALTMKPFLFGSGGVDDDAVKCGATWCVWTTDYDIYKIVPRTYTESFEDLVTNDNINITLNAYIKIQIQSGKTPVMLKGFGNDTMWYKNNIQETFRTYVRNKASDRTCFELASDRKVLDSLSSTVLSEMTAYVKQIGMPVDIQQVIIGAATPPKEVIDETTETATQKQRILTQEAKKLAEDSRKAAEIAKADADQAYQKQMNMTIDQYLALRQLEMIQDKQNVSIILGSGVMPTKDIK